jgi:hypothetical protein
MSYNKVIRRGEEFGIDIKANLRLGVSSGLSLTVFSNVVKIINFH